MWYENAMKTRHWKYTNEQQFVISSFYVLFKTVFVACKGNLNFLCNFVNPSYLQKWGMKGKRPGVVKKYAPVGHVNRLMESGGRKEKWNFDECFQN